MDFMELIAHIEASGEKVFADRAFEILTATNRYVRVGNDWQNNNSDGVLRSKMGRSGETFFWGPKLDPSVEAVRSDTSKEVVIDKLKELGVDSIDDQPKKPAKVPCNAIGVRRSCLMGTQGCSVIHKV